MEKFQYVTSGYFPDFVTYKMGHAERLYVYLDDKLMGFVTEAKRGEDGYVKYLVKEDNTWVEKMEHGSVRFEV
jgi:hypothetical protein